MSLVRLPSLIFYNFQVNAIKSIRFQVETKNQVGTILLSMLSGFIVGGIVGLATMKDDPEPCLFCITKEEKALPIALIGMGLGLGVSGIIISPGFTFNINGNQKRYNEYRKKISRFRLKPLL